ncbi:DNA polymerase III subunit delta [Roseateles saccharophilus]|uniref:DNA polymerase III subunit delta n=1 Tax=Roseateles saccharophilus TaxID=304 RepID=A0A4V2VT22_ROSSA|nr:DNA polymerase III subunit delta [Roseateles saccharophilus]MDG0832859.1 DNA polymerase III subunit delta [Roseateles saccharophilus]TCV04530.1 DNA polymerase III delta subunit [Roseateles saccharophilus]
MQLRTESLAGHLAKGLARIYTVHGDEPLLAQEAADQIRAAARAQGFGERQIFTVAGAYFDWAPVLAAAQAMSLFAERQFIEIRIPGGKPGKDGSEALQRYAETAPDDVLTLVTLPRLDKTQLNSAWFTALDGNGVSLRVEPVERRQLPAWLAQRLKAQGQSVPEGEDGQKALAFFADRVEGNLLAAHQELQKLALLHPKGELTLADIEAAVLDVARFDVFKLSEAVLAGSVPRLLRMLDGLEAEGEAAVLVHWNLAEDARALARVRAALDAGKPLPLALREARVWGVKERLVERIAPRLDSAQTGALVQAAQVCDGLVKGLRHPDWPSDPWAALRRFALMLAEAASGKSGTVLTVR